MKWSATSKTVWFNLLVGGPMIVDELIALINQSGDIIPGGARQWLVFLLIAGNIILRRVTTEPMTFLPPKPESKEV